MPKLPLDASMDSFTDVSAGSQLQRANLSTEPCPLGVWGSVLNAGATTKFNRCSVHYLEISFAAENHFTQEMSTLS